MSSTEADLVEQAPNEKKRTTPEKYGLDAMFAPSSVAVIGATGRPGTVGRTVLENLLRTAFKATCMPSTRSMRKCWGTKPTRAFATSPAL